MMIKDLSAKLVAAAAEINQKSRAKFVEEQNALHEKMAAKQMKMPTGSAPEADPPAVSNAHKMAKTNNGDKSVKEEVEGSIPKTPREKELAAKHGNKKRITFGDVMKARGVGMKKEEVELIDELSKSTLGSYVKKAAADSTISRKIGADFENRASKARSPSMKDANTSLADKFKSDARKRKANVDKAVDRLTKEEAEQTQEGWDDMMKSVNANKGTGKFDKKEIKPGVTQYTRKSSTFDDGTGKDSDERRQDRERRKAVKEENMDTPGNSTHQCAIHVKSEQFGEGRTLTSQHAEPDAQGNIAWYDVMFAEGIHRVETKDIEVLVSEAHMMHKKKKKAM